MGYYFPEKSEILKHLEKPPNRRESSPVTFAEESAFWNEPTTVLLFLKSTIEVAVEHIIIAQKL